MLVEEMENLARLTLGGLGGAGSLRGWVLVPLGSGAAIQGFSIASQEYLRRCGAGVEASSIPPISDATETAEQSHSSVPHRT